MFVTVAAGRGDRGQAKVDSTKPIHSRFSSRLGSPRYTESESPTRKAASASDPDSELSASRFETGLHHASGLLNNFKMGAYSK